MKFRLLAMGSHYLDQEIRLPLWCLASIVLSAALVLFIRRSWRGTSSSKYLNEFACTLLWLSWALERVIIGYHGNYITRVVVTFVMLIVQPYLFQEARGNPGVLLMDYLRGKLSMKRAVTLFAFELMAIPFSIVFTIGVWRVVEQVSSSHVSAHTISGSDFLQVSFLQGFHIEALGMFLILSPEYIIRGHTEQILFSATLLTVMDVAIGHLTGGFFNVLSLATFAVMYTKSSIWYELLLVYCGGSVVGVLAAWITFVKRQR